MADYNWIIMQLDYVASTTDARSKNILNKVIEYVKELQEQDTATKAIKIPNIKMPKLEDVYP
jgi:hypothetical protein